MSLSTDASKVLALLAELKSGLQHKDKNIDSDVETLERVLRDPLFCAQLSEQDKTRSLNVAADSAQLGEAANNLLVDELKQHLRLRQADRVVEEVRREVEVKVAEFAAVDRPLAFCALDIDASNPEPDLVLVEAGEGANRRIVVVGPRDLSDRPRIGGDSVGLGDEILAIDRLVVAAGLGTSADVRRHLRDRATGCASESGRLTAVVTVKRRSPNMVLTGDWTEVQVVELTNDGSGLGFGIVGGRSTGVVVKTILPGSPADRDGRLRQGDHLLQIGHINLHGMSSQQVAMILRQQDANVRIVVGRPTTAASPAPLTTDAAAAASTSTTPAVPPSNDDCITISTREALCAVTLDEQLDAHKRATSLQPSPSTAAASAETRSPSAPRVASSSRAASVNSQHGQSAKTPEREMRQSEEDTYSDRKGATGSLRPDRGLEDMALTSFCRENWLPEQTETIVVDLVRDEQLGLGITVAGYVHRKAEIAGVFVKSLVAGSSAEHTGRICVHDLILEVNGRSLEGLSHAESVRALVESGTHVRLELIRFTEGSPQALCLAMLREQETETQVIDVQIPTYSAASSSNVASDSTAASIAEKPAAAAAAATAVAADVRERWRRRLGSDMDVITVELVADDSDDRLGVSLQGTVDVVDGTELCPHHYIDSIRPHGPAASSGRLKSGDELLQVNNVRLLGESHVTVRQALSKAAAGRTLLLTVARPSQAPPPANVYMPRPTAGTPFQSSYCPVLSAAGDDRLVKAKSEVSLAAPLETNDVLAAVARRLRSRSLQPLTGLAIWSSKPLIVQLEKTTKGLGFSVLDYQDPLHPNETVIVVRSLVPGGVAQQDGRIVPGDRLLFINAVDLSNASLAQAVAALKSAPLGVVHLGIAKPIPFEATAAGYSPPIISRSERVLAKGFSPRMNRRLIEPAFDLSDSESPRPSRRSGGAGGLVGEARRRLYPQAYYPLTTSGGETPSSSGWHPSVGSSAINGSYLSMISWSPASSRSLSPAGSPSQLRGSWAYDVVYLPSTLERSIMLQKGANQLGINLDATVDKGINGCVVKSISRSGAVGRDGRVKVGDLIVKVNTETLRGVTNSQARAILKRTNLIGTQCNGPGMSHSHSHSSITYIAAADAQQWREKVAKEPPVADYSNHGVSRLSPKIFPKFYRSPYLDRKDNGAPADNDYRTEAAVSPPNLRQQSSADSDAPTTSHVLTDRSCPSNLINGLAEIIVADDVVQAAIHDAFLEVIVSERIPDWTAGASAPSTSAAATTERRRSSRISPEKGSPPRTHDDDDDDDSDDMALNIEAEVLVDQQLAAASTSDEQAAGVSKKSAVVQKSSGSSGKTDKLSRNSSSGSESVHAGGSQHGASTRSKFWGEPRTVELIREPHRSFGISIVGGRVEVSHKGGLPGTGNTVSGIFIKSVLPNSPAGRSGQMNMGDRVISVNAVDLREATHEQAVEVIKNAKNPVRFVVQSLHSFSPHQMISSCSTSAASSPSGTPVSKTFPSPAYRDHSSAADKGDVPDRPSPSTPPPADDTVELDRRPSSSRKSELNDVRVESLIESAVHETVEATVEHEPTGDGDGRQSITLPPDESTPEAQSPMHHNDTEPNAEPRRASVQQQQQERSVAEQGEETAAAKMTQRERDRRKIERNSAATLPRTDDDPETEDDFFYTSKKIQNKYGELKGELIQIKLDRPTSGLGLSLAGNRDRDKLSVFVVGIRDDSPLLSASRPIRVGDELLEINGKVLFGLSHLNASSKIRECTDSKIRLVVLRRPEALDEMAVRPPEAALSRSQTEPAVHREKNASPVSPTATDHASARRQLSVELGEPRQVRVRKGSAGFGITIAEATTAGSTGGILLVTNVSPDAPVAEERSLKVGDQVLSVNGRSVQELSSSQVADMMQNVAQNELLLTVAARPVVTLPASPAPASPAAMTSSLDADASRSDRSSASPSLTTTGNEVVRKKSNASFGGLDKVGVEPGKETLIEIDKDGKGLGLSIVGGSDTVLGTVVIHEVYPDGAAAVDGRLKPGDQVLEVNGQSLRGVSHELAITALRKTPAKVRLLVYRDINLQLSLLDPTQIYNIFEIELFKKPGRGLGLSIVGRKNEPGVYLSEVVKGGAAEADNRLMQGDQILAVNGQDVTSSMQEDVAAMLKVCMGRVLLKVGRWKLSDGATAPAPSTVLEPGSPSRQSHSASPVNSTASEIVVKTQAVVLSPDSIKEEPTSPVAVEREPPPPPSAPSRPGQISGAVPQVTVETEEAPPVPHSELSPVTEEPSSGDQKSLLGNEDEGAAISAPSSPAKSDRSDVEDRVTMLADLVEEGCESLMIELNKAADQQLGMGIGKRSRGILITSLQPGSTAAEKLKVGDRIMAVNGQAVTDQVSAVTFVKASPLRLFLQIARLIDDSKAHRRRIEVELIKDKDGFGFSIIGGEETPGGLLPVVVKRVIERGPAFGRLFVGDELAAINGQSLVGASHSTAVEYIRMASGPTAFVVMRAGTDVV